MLELIKTMMLIQIALRMGMGEYTAIIFVIFAGIGYITDLFRKKT